MHIFILNPCKLSITFTTINCSLYTYHLLIQTNLYMDSYNRHLLLEPPKSLSVLIPSKRLNNIQIYVIMLRKSRNRQYHLDFDHEMVYILQGKFFFRWFKEYTCTRLQSSKLNMQNYIYFWDNNVHIHMSRWQVFCCCWDMTGWFNVNV